MTKLHLTVAILSLILPINYGSSRPIEEKSSLVSDGLDQTSEFSLLELDLPTKTVTCEPIYGFLPCTTTLWGQLFLLVVYEYLLFLSEKFISDGSNLFFEMVGTCIFGARTFHILRMFPRVILVLVSGVTASEEATRTMATISMSLLAGSTIIMLTLIWVFVIAFGSYDLSDTSSSSNPENANDKKPFSFTGYGVRTDDKTKHNAKVMLTSMIPFLILGLSKLLTSATAKRLAVLISLIISLIFLFGYCISQAFRPWIQQIGLEYLISNYIRRNSLHTHVSPNGTINREEIERFFNKIDKDCDSVISSAELRAFIVEIEIEEFGLDVEDIGTKIMEVFDISKDSTIREEEFIGGMKAWLKQANNEDNYHARGESRFSRSSTAKKNNNEKQSLLPAEKGNEVRTWWKWWNYSKAAFLIILGIAIIVLFTTPLVQTVVDFSNSAHFPPFFVSYVVIPIALSFRLALRVITSAKHKTEEAASLAISKIYGAVFMNNVVGLVIFLTIVYVRNISWGVSAEVLIVLIICTAMGAFATFTTKIQFWTCVLVLLLYPISLLLLYVLTYGFVWS